MTFSMSFTSYFPLILCENLLPIGTWIIYEASSSLPISTGTHDADAFSCGESERQRAKAFVDARTRVSSSLQP